MENISENTKDGFIIKHNARDILKHIMRACEWFYTRIIPHKLSVNLLVFEVCKKRQVIQINLLGDDVKETVEIPYRVYPVCIEDSSE